MISFCHNELFNCQHYFNFKILLFIFIFIFIFLPFAFLILNVKEEYYQIIEGIYLFLIDFLLFVKLLKFIENPIFRTNNARTITEY